MTLYRLTAPIPAVRHPPAGAEIADRVTLPVGAVLVESAVQTILVGMVGVAWGARDYSVYPKDLCKKAERVSTA
jgi:hypothetical protein